MKRILLGAGLILFSVIMVSIFRGCHFKAQAPAAVSLTLDSSEHWATWDSVQYFSPCPDCPTCPNIDSLISEKLEYKRQRDSALTEMFIANYSLARVRKYLNICLKDPTQDKFLKGWIKRAIQ